MHEAVVECFADPGTSWIIDDFADLTLAKPKACSLGDEEDPVLGIV